MGKRVAESPRESASGIKKRHPLRWTLIALGVAVIGLVAWVGVRGILAKTELEAAIPLAQTVKTTLLDNEPEKAAAELAALQKHTAAAVSLTSDPVWRAAEFVPVLGSNLTAFREAAAIVGTVSRDALSPIVKLAGIIDVSSFKPINGQINLQPLLDAQESVGVADDVVRTALAQVRDIDTSQTIHQVDAAVAKLDGVLADASGTLASVRTTVNLLPGMLGVDGPRNYLLLFQNNAETRALGGNPASLALVHVENGKIDLAQQASSADLSSGQPAMDIGANLLDLYANNLSPGAITGYVQNITMIPDFPTVAQLAKAMWAAKFGVTVDTVVSFDPIALSYLLGATGPVVLPNGDVVTGDNVVALMLADVYARFPDPGDQDVYFAQAAKGVFDIVKSGAGDSKALVAALTHAVDEGRLLVWSSVAAEQKVIEGTTFSGALPLKNTPSTDVGVYFNDFSTSKLNYYMDAVVGVNAPTCEASDKGFSTVVSVTLSSRVPADAADTLPDYVLGLSRSGVITVDAVVLGPIDAAYTTFDPGTSGATLVNSGVDKGRPVARVSLTLAPGESKTISVTMTSAPGVYGPLKVRTTPLVSKTDIVATDAGCK